MTATEFLCTTNIVMITLKQLPNLWLIGQDKASLEILEILTNVFMSTCPSGYANASTTLPIFNMTLARAIDYKGLTGFTEQPLQNVQVLIRIYRVVPKNRAVKHSSGALARFLQRHNVRGYRSVNHRSASRPAGVQILYGEL